MSNLQITELEVRDLLNRYRSEMRKLQFQMERTQETINELENTLGVESPTPPIQYTGEESQPPAKKKGPGRPAKKRGPGRPPKSESSKRGPGRPPKKKKPGRPPKKKSSKRGPGRPPKKKGPGRPPKKRGRKPGSYKLSDWDQFLLDSIDKAGKPLINKELAKRAEEWEQAKDLPKEEIKQYISRSIHKLANKHDKLKKVPYEGRGYAYATENMVFNNGKLKKEYNR